MVYLEIRKSEFSYEYNIQNKNKSNCCIGAFTNDVIILGGGGLENMTKGDGGGGVGLKMTSLFYYNFWEKFQTT